jgi:S1-C subfamily serine protease
MLAEILLLLLPVAKLLPTEVPADLYRVTAQVGGCAATIVRPVQDAKGDWHWLAVTAGHCVRDDRWVKIKLNWPPSERKEFDGRVIYRSDDPDLAVVEFNPGAAIPYADVASATLAQAWTVGYPYGALLGKSVEIKKTTGGTIQVAGDIWYGHSGGGLFQDGKLVGIASARDGRGAGYFTPATAAHHLAETRITGAG